MRPVDIGIIGSGTAGAAAALFLSRAGHTVTVYERVEHPRPLGAGILLQPTGQAVLARLGLRDAVVGRANPIDDLRCERLGARRVFRVRYAALPGGHRGYGLHRGALFELLFAALQRQPLTLKLGVEVRDLAVTADGEGQWFVTADGRRLGPLVPLGWIRDRLMPIATAIPAVERLMVKAMAGLSLGFGLGRPLRLPPPP